MWKNIYLLLFLCFGINANAQTESNSKQISKIQKDKHYIWAEGVDTIEANAYQMADEELESRIETYVLESGMAEAAKEIVVKNISQFKNEIKMARGGLYRVFLYVKQSDIVESSSPVKVIAIEEEDNEEVEQTKEVNNQTEVEQKPAAPKIVETQIESSSEEQESKGVHNTAQIFSSLPNGKLEVVRKIASAKNLNEAYTLLNNYNNSNLVKNFGVKKDCKDEINSYWVVPNDGGVSVLSPQRNGNRWSYSTGNVDSLRNYKSGLWFRF